jgi:nucleoside-diphosphate-sugar epimerase
MRKILFLGYGPISSSIISNLLASDANLAIEVITSRLTDSTPKGFKVSDPLIWIGDQLPKHFDVVINSWRDLGDEHNTSRLEILKTLASNPKLTLINLSSVAVYGECDYPKNELSEITPKNGYGDRKWQLELHLSSLRFLSVINLRISNVYGHVAFTDFFNKAVESYFSRSTFYIASPELIFRDFISLQDFLDAFNRILAKYEFFPHQGVLDINIGSGKSYSIGEVFAVMQEISPFGIPFEIINPVESTIMKSFIDVSKMENELQIEMPDPLDSIRKVFLKVIRD